MSHAEPAFPVIAEASRRARAPWAASLAGLLFAALFTAGMVLIRSQPFIGADQQELDRLFADGADIPGIIGGLYLLPFAGVMFLWFIAVIRDQIGEREDRFFATVFFGSGLLFVAILFAATAVASAPLVGSRYLAQGPPSVAEFESARALAYTLFFAFGTRAAAVFLISMATIGLRSGVLPVWFGRAGYLVGLLLLLVVSFFDWIVLILPVWIALISLYILRRERARRHAPGSDLLGQGDSPQ